MKILGHKAKYVSCGLSYTAFIDLEDYVWVFGSNSHQNLGLQGVDKLHHPQKITRVYDEGQVFNIDFKVRQVHCSDSVTIFVDLEENLWVTGDDKFLNIKSEIPARIPRIKASKVAAGFKHMVVMGYYN